MTILGRSEELVSRCVECDLAEPESLASLGGSAPGVVDGILSKLPEFCDQFWEVHDMLDYWNKNMANNFVLSWINCIDESMSKFFNEYTCPGLMFVL